MLPWEFLYEFDEMDIDINEARWGLWLDSVDNQRLETLRWNEEWRDFLGDKRNWRPDKVQEKYIDMWNDPRFEDILKRGRKTKDRYPNETARRARDLLFEKAKGRKILTILEVAGVLLAAQNLANAAAGGCDCHLLEVKRRLDDLHRRRSQATCQDAMWALYKYFECAGLDDLPNAIQFRRSVLSVCTQF
jgi:hypothetical protein